MGKKNNDVALKVTKVSPKTGKLTTEIEHKRVRISLAELVQDSRAPPLAAANFLSFLSKRFSEESFLFLQATEDYHEQVNKTSAAEERGGEIYRTELSATWELARSIFERFIKAGSDLQVNISASIVDEIKSHIDKMSNMRSLFDEAEKEAEQLIMSQGLLHQFISENVQNINERERTLRRIIGYGAFLLGIAYIVVLELAFSVSPLWRMGALIFFMYGSGYIISAHHGVCVYMAKKGRKMTDDGKFSYLASTGEFSHALEGRFLLLVLHGCLSFSLVFSLFLHSFSSLPLFSPSPLSRSCSVLTDTDLSFFPILFLPIHIYI